MEDCNSKHTPEEKIPMSKDLDGDPCCEDWDYKSIVGMLSHLAGSTRLDISCEFHQCAHFSHASKASHEIGVKNIVRHLKGTRDKALIMRPNVETLLLDLHADADFAELFASEDKLDPVSLKNRTGILLNFSRAPVHWS